MPFSIIDSIQGKFLKHKPIRLRTGLIMMTLGIVIPFVIASSYLAISIFNDEQERVNRANVAYAKTLSFSLDSQFEIIQSGLQTLSNSFNAPGNSLPQIYKQAQLLAESRKLLGVVLSDSSGQIIFSTTAPYGQKLPKVEGGGVKEFFVDGKSSPSILRMGPIVKKWIIAVRVPVFDSKGKVIYALSGTVTAQQLNNFLNKQAIQDNQIITIVDPVGRIAARSNDSSDLIGALVRPKYLQHLIDAPSGQFEGVNLKDVPVSLTYYQSPVSKYTLSVATPLSDIKQDQWRALKPFLWLALGVLALGLILGIRVSDEIARSVAQLIPLARDLGLGKSVLPLVGPISEVNDVATALSEASAQLNYAQHQAFHDTLTGLSNRAMISYVTEQQIALARREHHSFALLFLDIDKFKTTNDTYGHDIGDLLLVEVAARLKHAVRAYDTVGRLGGDEFVILLPNTNLEMASRTADHVLKVMSDTVFSLNHIRVQITCSIGIALYPDDAENSSALFKLADTALYEAKAQGRNRAVVAKDL